MRTEKLVGAARQKIAIQRLDVYQAVGSKLYRIDKRVRAVRLGPFNHRAYVVDRGLYNSRSQGCCGRQ